LSDDNQRVPLPFCAPAATVRMMRETAAFMGEADFDGYLDELLRTHMRVMLDLKRRIEEPDSRPTRVPTRGTVYFMQGAAGEPIKIGFSANLEQRLQNLRKQSGRKLRVIASLEGTLATEREIHERFAAHRLEGEWFAPVPELLHLIAELKG
jgi:hypothetical protein